jgi:hypothetical protein
MGLLKGELRKEMRWLVEGARFSEREDEMRRDLRLASALSVRQRSNARQRGNFCP